MPIYEYQCEACGNEFEDLVKIDDPPPPCPNCEGKSARIISDIGATKLRGKESAKWKAEDTKRTNAKRANEQRAREGN